MNRLGQSIKAGSLTRIESGEKELSVRHVASAKLPTQWGVFTIHGFEDEATGKEHIALHMDKKGNEIWFSISLTKIIIDSKVMLHSVWCDISIPKKKVYTIALYFDNLIRYYKKNETINQTYSLQI